MTDLQFTYDKAVIARESAQDHLRVLRDQAEIVRSLGASVRTRHTRWRGGIMSTPYFNTTGGNFVILRELIKAGHDHGGFFGPVAETGDIRCALREECSPAPN